jgi:uroporphyrinogen decarboxylase
LAHQEPDRVPVDLGATESSGIMGIAYNRLKERLGIGGRTQIYDLSQMIAKVEQPVLEAIGADAMPLLIEPKAWKPWTLQDGSPAEIPQKLEVRELENGDLVQLAEDGTIVSRCPEGGLYFDTIYHPLEDATTVGEIDAGQEHFDSFDWPSYLDEDYDDLRRKARDLYEHTDTFIVGNLWVHLLAAAQTLRGFEPFMMDMMADKQLAHRLLRRQMEAYWPRVERYLEAVGEYVQIIQVNDDLGAQNGPQISPKLYREMIKPYHKELWSHIKQMSGKPLLLHSCGSVYEFIPDFIEMGIDALNPVQMTARDMDTKKLKREFGKDLTFWGGGCDTQNVLPFGSSKEVEEEVKRRIEDLAPGGGFVFTQVHNIQAGVPVENVVAMYEAVEKYGGY